MPCSSDGYDSASLANDTAMEAHKRADKLEALLCGVMTILENNKTLDGIKESFDEKEAGHPVQELTKWWEDHKVRDERRRAAEDRAKKDKEARVNNAVQQILAITRGLSHDEQMAVAKHLTQPPTMTIRTNFPEAYKFIGPLGPVYNEPQR